MKKNLLLLIGIIVLSCSSQNNSMHDSSQGAKDKKMAIINDLENIKWISGTNGKGWSPNEDDVKQIDILFTKAINSGDFYFLEQPSLETLKERYRQYVCFMNEKGDKIVYVNSFCKIPEVLQDGKLKPLDWKKEVVDTADGGSCYWKMKINLTTHQYYDMMINGES